MDGFENILTEVPRVRWAVAFGFGLVHGFGFSFALRNTLQFAGDHVLTSLLSFNLGVELGQILVLLVLVVALNAILRFSTQQRLVVIIVSALVAHTAWHWLGERYALLRQYDLPGALQWTRAEPSRFEIENGIEYVAGARGPNRPLPPTTGPREIRS